MIDQGHVKLLGQHCIGETFVVACHDYVDFLSHGTILEQCTVEIRGSARSVVFHAATICDSLIRASRQFKNYSWHDITLERCTFQGRFRGCDFGSRPDAYPDGPQGAVIGCDFSQAKLHLCRFFNCDMSQIQLPLWPCVTLLDPAVNRLDWLSIPLPETLRIEQEVLGDPNPGQSASNLDVEEWCRKSGASSVHVRDLLSEKSYILGARQ